MNPALTKRILFDGEDMYWAVASAGAAEDSAVWFIRKLEKTVTGYKVLMANGSTAWNQKWSEVSVISYS